MQTPTRRAVLRGASLATAAGATGLAATVQVVPATADGRGRGRRHQVTTFVFVTGASGSASAPAELAARGHRVLGVDLPGHGPLDGQFHASYQAPQDLKTFATVPSPVAGVTLDDYATRVTGVVRQVAASGPVVLVGSSMGGATISRVGNAVPHLIDRIVYDSAYLCVELPTIAEYMQTPEAEGNLGDAILPAIVGNPAEIGALRTNWRLGDPDFLAGAKAAFMEDGTDAEFMAMLNSLQPDESLTVPSAQAQVERRTWGRIPRTYIRHTLDRMIPIALQDRMIAEADRLTPHSHFDVHTVHTSHATSTPKYREIIEILDHLG